MQIRNVVLFTAILVSGPLLAQTEPDNAAAPLSAETGAKASAELKGVDGASHGTITFTQTNAGVLLKAELKGLPAGPHGMHFHEVGKCEPPFESAGAHYNPTNVSHGYMAEGGPHVGDMPNVSAPESGVASVEHLNAFVSLSADSGNTLFDEDGTSIVIHAKADDYASQPSGDSGDRIACGVVSH